MDCFVEQRIRPCIRGRSYRICLPTYLESRPTVWHCKTVLMNLCSMASKQGKTTESMPNSTIRSMTADRWPLLISVRAFRRGAPPGSSRSIFMRSSVPKFKVLAMGLLDQRSIVEPTAGRLWPHPTPDGRRHFLASRSLEKGSNDWSGLHSLPLFPSASPSAKLRRHSNPIPPAFRLHLSPVTCPLWISRLLRLSRAQRQFAY